ncbi:putative metal-dependent phosphoesterase [Candidatus Promineifilum breve]|uniref:Metal-dependent phosphoesterase n=1 Tax=Candidatus Promineifilum breve TaxID=1806508 RepID=A0A160T3N5_9CHLR|nr:PHP domain-containing protein [Candidatus Promineifilum breve]CUS03628.2 putative metal-dependent phosphoesterase [Candidatus Promineifilum breve]
MERTFIADLHNHTTASDGEYTPTELIHKAAELGLEAIGVTDHDTLNGLDEALAAGAAVGLRVVPGVEVSLRFKRPYFTGTLHYLLYIPDDLLADADFRRAAEAVLSQGRGGGLVRARVAAINAEFGPAGATPLLTRDLTAEEIEALADNVTRRHFALALSTNHGLNKEQVNQLIGNDSRAYIPSGIDPATLTPLLHAYPQLVRVFAHPAAGSYPGESLYNEVLPPIDVVEILMPEFLDDNLLGLDGLEVQYPGHVAEHRALMAEWAERHDLIQTGGSDCHDRVNRPLGVAGVDADGLNGLLALLGEPVSILTP